MASLWSRIKSTFGFGKKEEKEEIPSLYDGQGNVRDVTADGEITVEELEAKTKDANREFTPDPDEVFETHPSLLAAQRRNTQAQMQNDKQTKETEYTSMPETASEMGSSADSISSSTRSRSDTPYTDAPDPNGNYGSMEASSTEYGSISESMKRGRGESVTSNTPTSGQGDIYAGSSSLLNSRDGLTKSTETEYADFDFPDDNGPPTITQGTNVNSHGPRSSKCVSSEYGTIPSVDDLNEKPGQGYGVVPSEKEMQASLQKDQAGMPGDKFDVFKELDDLVKQEEQATKNAHSEVDSALADLKHLAETGEVRGGEDVDKGKTSTPESSKSVEIATDKGPER